MDATYEYCAAKFLDQWLRKESALHAQLRKPDGEAVRAALAYFRVSRGFSNIASAKTSSTVANLLVQHDRYVTAKTAAVRVSDLAAAFGEQFDLHNLSAASKLLWLRTRSPFVILDSRAVRALGKLGRRFDKRSYAEYYEAWRAEYVNRSSEIESASRQLPSFSRFTAAGSDVKAVESLVDQPWFTERVFDQYLWLRGAP